MKEILSRHLTPEQVNKVVDSVRCPVGSVQVADRRVIIGLPGVGSRKLAVIVSALWDECGIIVAEKPQKGW